MNKLVAILLLMVLLSGCMSKDEANKLCDTDCNTLDFEYHELIQSPSQKSMQSCYCWNEDSIRQTIWTKETTH